MTSLSRNLISPKHVRMRLQDITAMRFDGTDAGAQAIALWVKESGDINDRSYMRYRNDSDHPAGIFTFDVLGDGGQIVDPEDWVVRIAGFYLVMSESTFDAIFDIVHERVATIMAIERAQ